jgi:hypothetical protein
MRRRWILGALVHLALIELAIVGWLYLGMAYTCPCGGCERYMHSLMIGRCNACGGGTWTISHRLCEPCAEAKGICEDCGGRKRFVLGVEDYW